MSMHTSDRERRLVRPLLLSALALSFLGAGELRAQQHDDKDHDPHFSWHG